MSKVSRRAARRELEAAQAFGVKRTHRSRYESAPDVEPVVLSNGDTLSVEVKSRAALPALLRDALDQARGYLPGSVPVAVLAGLGGSAVACLPLRDFARLLGSYGLLARSTAVGDAAVAVGKQVLELDALSPVDVVAPVADTSVDLPPVAGREDLRDQLRERDLSLAGDAATVAAGRHLAVGEGQQAENTPVARTAADAAVGDSAAPVLTEVAAPTATTSGLAGRPSAGCAGSLCFHGER